MFGFLTSSSRKGTGPLVTPKTAENWLRRLPAIDLLDRQRQLAHALEALSKSQLDIDLNRVAAIQHVDAMSSADRRQLFKQFCGATDPSSPVANRVWQAAYDICQAFMMAYHVALEQAFAQRSNAKWKAVLPLIIVRLIHYYGMDAKLRVCRYERWIPGKWVELHQVYRQAEELGITRETVALPAAKKDATSWSIEHEYLYTLLMHQLNTGNLNPAELDWAGAQLRAWSRKLRLEESPDTQEGFFVDLTGRAGPQRRQGDDKGGMLRYLDPTPLAESLERAFTQLRDVSLSAPGTPGTVLNQKRLLVLQKLLPALAPSSNVDLRRGPRTPVAAPARVRAGLARICMDVAAGTSLEEGADFSSAEQIEVFAVTGAPRIRRKLPDEELTVDLEGNSDPLWEVKDRSVAGLRIAASGGMGQSLILGGLIGVRMAGRTESL